MTHSRSCDMEIGRPSVEHVTRGRMFNLGSSYFHVPLTTVRHLLNVTKRHDVESGAVSRPIAATCKDIVVVLWDWE